MQNTHVNGQSAPNVKPYSILRTLDAATLDALPFRLHPALLAVWIQPTAKEALADLIERDGGIRDSLLCASVVGDPNSKPILYDGMTRLAIYFERKLAGKVEPLPGFVVREFSKLSEVLKQAIQVQGGRRNVTVAELTYAGLELKRYEGFHIEAKPQGRQPKALSAKANKDALKRLPDAKTLAKELGVSDFAVRTMLRTYKHPEIQRKALSGQITLKGASYRLEGVHRDKAVHSRQKMTKERRAFVVTLPDEALPEVIVPDGIYTTDACKGMDLITPSTIALVNTSIPYACDVQYDVTGGFDGDLDAYLDTFVRQPFTRYKKILQSGGRVVLNFDDTYRSASKSAAGDQKSLVPNIYNMVKEISKIAEDEFGFLLLGRRSWFKQNCPNYFSHGSRDCRTPKDNPNTEHIYIWAKDSVTFPCTESDSDVRDEFDAFAVTQWYIRPQTRKPTHITVEGKEVVNPDFHPVPFPEEIPYRVIKMFCPTNGIVLDPYSGSGTTCFVARALGRPFIGLDNSKGYNAAARKRLASLDGLSPEERLKRITRFVPAGERSDGCVPHKNIKG